VDGEAGHAYKVASAVGGCESQTLKWKSPIFVAPGMEISEKGGREKGGGGEAGHPYKVASAVGGCESQTHEMEKPNFCCSRYGNFRKEGRKGERRRRGRTRVHSGVGGRWRESQTLKWKSPIFVEFPKREEGRKEEERQETRTKWRRR
jgi:hypothetical protein